jgi:hypothetical protein
MSLHVINWPTNSSNSKKETPGTAINKLTTKPKKVPNNVEIITLHKITMYLVVPFVPLKAS